MSTRSPKHRTRRFLQFSLRALLVFVLLVSLGMSWLAVKLEKARRQKEAVEAIERAGGFAKYDYQFHDHKLIALSAESPAPKWARALLGDDFFHDVTVMGLRSSAGDDEAIYLTRLTALEVLFLTESQITDAGLEHLKGMTKLGLLCLSDTQVTDAGLTNIEGLTNLYNLNLSSTEITDAGLKHLKGLPNLEVLHLMHTATTDAGLEHLRGLTSLEVLDLSGTQVTDAGLKHLKGLTNLIELNIYYTQVTFEGADKLQETLPECDIHLRAY